MTRVAIGNALQFRVRVQITWLVAIQLLEPYNSPVKLHCFNNKLGVAF